MRKSPGRTRRKTTIKRSDAGRKPPPSFDEVLSLIDSAQARSFAAVNTALIELYWSPARIHAVGSNHRLGVRHSRRCSGPRDG
jgi:hypothetical protein